MNISSEKFKINLQEGYLAGILESPVNKTRGLGVLMHGRRSSKDSDTYKNIAEIFHKNNFQTFRFDFRGHGKSSSSPNWEIFGIMDWVNDLENVVGWLEEKDLLKGEIILLGSSFAADTSLIYQGKHQKADKIILLSPGIGKNSSGTKDNFYRRDWWDNAFETTKIKFSKYETLLKKIKSRVYLLHGDSDASVPIEQSKELEELIGDNVELFVIEGGEHNFWKSEKAMQQRRKLINEILSST